MTEEKAEIVYHPPAPKQYAGLRIKLGSRSRKLPEYLEQDEVLVIREPGNPPMYAIYIVDTSLQSFSLL